MKKDMNALINAYYKAALIKGTFDYYIICEKQLECEAVDEEVMQSIHSAFGEILSSSNEDKKQDILKVEHLRNQIIQKMQVLTAYTDQLQVYEYVLNRCEQRYQKEELIDEEVFANKLFQFIFLVKDNMLINDNIKACLAQLPVRMTKMHYFDLIRQSILLYKGSEQEAVNSYLYILRCSAMLYEPEGIDDYFLNHKDEMELFKRVDYNKLTKEEYSRYTLLLSKMAENLIIESDFYVSAQDLLNCIDTILISRTSMEQVTWEGEEDCRKILSDVYTTRFDTLDMESRQHLEDTFSKLEGEQEKAYDEIQRLEAKITVDTEKDSQEILLNLEKMGKLMSSSVFTELELKINTQLADENYIEVQTKQFIQELSDLFDKSSKFVVRSIMAATLSKMPVFFNSKDEVYHYIKNSLKQCSDFAEKNVSMKLLNEFMDTI